MPDDTFKDFVLDQLNSLPGLHSKAMFGGHGLYSNKQFFGILFEGRLYFKVGVTTRATYAKSGMKPFTYAKAKRIMSMSYYEVPPEILEDREQLRVWADQALRLAAASAGKKRARSKQGAG